VVVADSRQVYRRLDAGTNKPSAADRSRTRFHLVDMVEPDQSFSVFDFVHVAAGAIKGITARGRLPIVEGGSMLYLQALIEGFSLGVPPRPERRRQLAGLPPDELRRLLHRLDPEAAVDIRNPVRIVRAIELLEVAGPPLARLRQRHAPEWDVVRVGLKPEWPVLDRRLQERVARQLEAGLVAETEQLLESGVDPRSPALRGIGYAEVVGSLQQSFPADELPQRILRANRRYARRQMRWWGRDRSIRWFDAEPDPVPGILSYLEQRLA
jgi:tRNA dimethylallyltransferase